MRTTMTGKVKQDLVFVLDDGFAGGGAARVASELLDVWAREGRSIEVISNRPPNEDFYAVPSEVRRTVLDDQGGPSANALVGAWRNLRRLRRLRHALKKSDAPVVLSFLTETNIKVVLSASGMGKRVIVSERNDTTRQRFSWPWRFLRWALYRFATVVTANSRDAVRHMAAYVPSERLVFVPNPISIPERAARPSASQRLLTVGRLTAHKRHALVIEALASIGDRAAEWSLDIVGDGSEHGRLSAFAAACGLGSRVRLPGHVRQVADYYHSAGIFVLPSDYEGTPNALLEAMAAGLPCVVADCLPGALAHVDDGVSGMVFRASDAEDLAEKIGALMDSPDLRDRLGAAARERMQAMDPSAVLNQWDTLLFSSECR